MPTALITGLVGFTGRYLAQLLKQQGYRVAGLQARAQPSDHELHVCDLLDREGLRKVVDEVRPDVVAHLAAISFVAHGDVDAIYRTNVVGTRNLLEALADSPYKPQSVLLASSANIYGNTATDPISEEVTPAPANDYAVSKLAMEYMAGLWFDRLPITIVRPFNYTGVGQASNFLLPKIMDHFKRRVHEIELGNLDVARDFSDVRTVVAAYAALLAAPPAGETFNVCSGVAYSLQQVLDMAADIAGYRLSVKVNPAFVRTNEVKVLRGDGKRLSKLVGNVPSFTLKQTLHWMYNAK